MNFNKPPYDAKLEPKKKNSKLSSLRKFLGPLIAAGSILTGMPNQGKADTKGDLDFDSVALDEPTYYDQYKFGEHHPSEIGVESGLKEMAEEGITLLKEAVQNNKIDQIGYNVIATYIDHFNIRMEQSMHPDGTKNIQTTDGWKEYFLKQIKKLITHFDISDDAPLVQDYKNEKGNDAELVGMITEGEKLLQEALRNKKIYDAQYREIVGDALQAIGEGCLRLDGKDHHAKHIQTAHNLTYKGKYNLFMLTIKQLLEEAQKNNRFTY